MCEDGRMVEETIMTIHNLFIIETTGGYYVPATIIWNNDVKADYEDQEDKAIVGYNNILRLFL